ILTPSVLLLYTYRLPTVIYTLSLHDALPILTVISSFNGREKQEKASILSNNGGLLLQYKDRIELNLPENARLAFKTIPDGLNNTPVLSVILKNLPETVTQYRADLSYLTRGISWNADYIAKLDDETKTLKLE